MTRKKYTPTFLKGWRERTGATQPEMAEAMGFSRVHLGNVERGVRPYTQEFLEKAVAYLRRWFPWLTVADILSVDPLDPAQLSLSDLARHIPPAQRENIAELMRAVAARAGVVFEPAADGRPTVKVRKRAGADA